MDNKKIKIISFLDECRWNEDEDNYYTINYSKQIEKDIDSQMLTHWISYIIDRQMPFKQIWDVGGYIFSKLVFEYKQYKDWEKLLEIEKDGEIVENKTTFFKIDKRDGRQTENGSKNAFATKIEDSNCRNKINKKYIKDDMVYFKSRFIPNDYMSIYRTLFILAKLRVEKSFTEYIKLVLKKACPEGNMLAAKDAVEALANGLYFLTYADGKGKEKGSELEKYIGDCQKNEIFNPEYKLEEKLEKYIKDKGMTRNKRGELSIENFDNKRLWCAIRDYIKAKEFCGEFEQILIRSGIIPKNQDVKKYIEEMKRYLELPGDVWNNNTNFSKCLFPENEEQKWYYDSEQEKYIREKQEEKTKIKKFNQFLRGFKEIKNMDAEWYPEQFDVTFNLASNLCSNKRCDICPLGEIRINKVKMLCIGEQVKESKAEKYCPVLMSSCGYKFKCPGECIIKEMIGEK